MHGDDRSHSGRYTLRENQFNVGPALAGGEKPVCLAIPGKILEILPERDNLALVDVVGVRRKIDVGLLQETGALPGDWVLIHVGFAMCKISEDDAHEQMRILKIMGEEAIALEEASGYGLSEERGSL